MHVPVLTLDNHDDQTAGFLFRTPDVIWSCARDSQFIQHTMGQGTHIEHYCGRVVVYINVVYVVVYGHLWYMVMLWFMAMWSMIILCLHACDSIVVYGTIMATFM